MPHRLNLVLLAAAGLALANRPAAAAPDDAYARAQIMIVSSYHLANNNRDMVNLPIEDVLTPQRQQEIERLVAGLARWNPTRIASEWPRADQAGLDQRYADYQVGRLTPTANERDQIALRLAVRLDLPQVYAVDWNGDAPGDPAAYDIGEWARRHGEADRLERFIAESQAEANQTAAAMRDRTVGEWYRDLNRPEARLAMHQSYFTLASFGDDDANPGAAWVGGWYARNLRIFNNIRELAKPGERVLVLYGAGHAYLLDQFVRESEAALSVDGRRFMK